MTSFIVETNKTDWIITLKQKENNKEKVNFFMNPIEIENDTSISFYTEKIQKVINCDFDEIYNNVLKSFKKLNVTPNNTLLIKSNIMDIMENQFTF